MAPESTYFSGHGRKVDANTWVVTRKNGHEATLRLRETKQGLTLQMRKMNFVERDSWKDIFYALDKSDAYSALVAYSKKPSLIPSTESSRILVWDDNVDSKR